MTTGDALRVIISLELRQRVRTPSWYVLLGTYTAVVAVVTVLLIGALPAFGDGETGASVLSAIIYFVLLLATLVTPALSGNAINGDRAEGTLATTQVTQVSTVALVLGKFVAAWISALAFLVASIPFLVLSVIVGGVRIDTMVTSLAVLVFELGVVAAIGVGLSGLLARPIFSIVVTYLAVAALSIGSLIVFVLGGLVTQDTVTNRFRDVTNVGFSDTTQCGEWQETTSTVPRFDRFWPVLMANPFVLLADATPTHFDLYGNPDDLFGSLKFAARSAQIPPEGYEYDACDTTSDPSSPTPEQVIESTVPGWFVGGLIHLVLAGGLLAAGISATRTPAKRLARGSRIA